jgi:hypothetical protein
LIGVEPYHIYDTTARRPDPLYIIQSSLGASMFVKALARYLSALFTVLLVNSTPGLEIVGNIMYKKCTLYHFVVTKRM